MLISARYLVEPLAFGGLVLAVVVLAAGDAISPISSEPWRHGGGRLPAASNSAAPLWTGDASLPCGISWTRFSRNCCCEQEEKLGNVEIPLRNRARWSGKTRSRWMPFLSFTRGPIGLVLDRSSVTIKENMSIGFIGPTGSGKSNFDRPPAWIARPTSGRVLH